MASASQFFRFRGLEPTAPGRLTLNPEPPSNSFTARFRLPAGVHEVRAVHLTNKRKEVVVVAAGEEAVVDFDMLAPP